MSKEPDDADAWVECVLWRHIAHVDRIPPEIRKAVLATFETLPNTAGYEEWAERLSLTSDAAEPASASQRPHPYWDQHGGRPLGTDPRPITELNVSPEEARKANTAALNSGDLFPGELPPEEVNATGTEG